MGGKLSVLERIKFSQNLVFHYVCDALHILLTSLTKGTIFVLRVTVGFERL